MKIYSWNLNGIRSAEKKLIELYKPDILMLQEIRANTDQISMFLKSINNYSYLFNDSGKPGYSGTGLYYLDDMNIRISSRGTISPILEQEERVIEFENDGILYLNVYTPNGNSSEERLNFKLRFYKELQEKAVLMYEVQYR
jgi:exodeoxyribonuclease-3